MTLDERGHVFLEVAGRRWCNHCDRFEFYRAAENVWERADIGGLAGMGRGIVGTKTDCPRIYGLAACGLSESEP